MGSLYVISAVGKDKPGLVYSVANVLRTLSINIVDIDARSVRGHFIMFLVIDISTSKSSHQEMMAALYPVRANFDIGFRVEPYKAGRRKVEKDLMMLTVMGIDRPGIVAELTGLCAGNNVNIERIKMIARGEYIAMELTVDTSDNEDVSGFRKVLYKFSNQTRLDVSLRHDDIFKKPKRMVVFDCDSTIIQEEIIDELAEVAGMGKPIKEMTKKAMNGELDFKKALRKRAHLLKGLTVEHLQMLSKTINLTPGAEDLVSTLRFMGYRVGVISGGFTFFTNYLKERLHLDYVYANELEIENGVLTGEITGDIIDAERKGDIIKEIAELEKITVDQIVAVGDGSNDRFMLQNAGLAIAFSPKEILEEYSDGIITNDNISGMLYFMGIPDSEVKKLKALKHQK